MRAEPAPMSTAQANPVTVTGVSQNSRSQDPGVL
jgi:hypothetical protein